MQIKRLPKNSLSPQLADGIFLANFFASRPAIFNRQETVFLERHQDFSNLEVSNWHSKL